jgi:nitroreductase
MDLFDVIKNRRSIRSFKPDPVSDKDIETILESARLAPSWANTQCWRFIVVKDPAVKNLLAGTAPGNSGVEAIRQAPVAIVAYAQLDSSGFYGGKKASDTGDWFMFDLGIAMEHMVLAAHALGLGTVHLGLFDSGKAASILNIPDGYRLISMIPVGYPRQQIAARPRKALSEIVYCEIFGNKYPADPKS